MDRKVFVVGGDVRLQKQTEQDDVFVVLILEDCLFCLCGFQFCRRFLYYFATFIFRQTGFALYL